VTNGPLLQIVTAPPRPFKKLRGIS